MSAERMVEVDSTLRRVITNVCEERAEQDRQWGQQNHSPIEWLSVLTEEVGEVAEMTNKAHWSNGPREVRVFLQELRRELIQVAAVAIAAVESLDRNELA